MKKYLLIALLVIVAVAVWIIYRATPAPVTPTDDSTALIPPLPQSPLDATYRIEDQEVTLVSGLASEESAPGSASREETRVWGEPIWGDVNGDGKDDAVIMLTRTGGGSGTFYYVALALAGQDGYLGMNAVFLGDRIAPQTIEVREEMILVNYADRAEGTSFADQPDKAVTAYLKLVGIELMRVDVSGEGMQVLGGELVYAHESRTFTPCGGEAYWIATSSRASAALQAIYTERTSGKDPYTPAYVVVSGTIGDGLTEGFGADYPYSISITQILSAPQDGACTATSTSSTQ